MVKALFIGGTGIISSACSRLALKAGIDLYHLNRGRSHRKIAGVSTILGDIHDLTEIRSVLRGASFDAVVNWVCFTPEEVKADIETFAGKTKQYIFISSASAYQKPIERLPITEDSPLVNPYWQYSRDKAACEKILMDAYRRRAFPATIVRPSHTYDNTLLPTDWGYTVIDRMRRGEKVIIQGDGTSIWVMTHADDFAVGLVGLLGQEQALGHAFHITSDELLNWNQIYQMIADELGVTLNCVHIPSDYIAKYDAEMGSSLLGDKAHSVIFDNAKIKRFVPDFHPVIPFREGIKGVLTWYLENKDRQIVNGLINQRIETIIENYLGGSLHRFIPSRMSRI